MILISLKDYYSGWNDGYMNIAPLTHIGIYYKGWLAGQAERKLDKEAH